LNSSVDLILRSALGVYHRAALRADPLARVSKDVNIEMVRDAAQGARLLTMRDLQWR
jgi:hypothetical protein